MKRGVSTPPTEKAFDFSFCRSGLPPVDWVKLALAAVDLKLAGIPSAAQFACRVVGSGPLFAWRKSHGSVAKPKKVLVGTNASWIAGERIACVKFPRKEISRTGAHRPPTVHVTSPPATEWST